MSQLSNFQIPVARVVIQGQTLILRGLNPSQFGWLYLSNQKLCDSLWEKYRVLESAEEATLQFIDTLIKTSPMIANQIIALACGSLPTDDSWEDDLAVASSFGAGYQAEILLKVGGLTFGQEMPPKKLLSLLVQALDDQKTIASKI